MKLESAGYTRGVERELAGILFIFQTRSSWSIQYFQQAFVDA